jgi:hypothetical protein
MYSFIRLTCWKSAGFPVCIFFILLTSLLFVSCKRYELDQWPLSYPKEVEEQVLLFIDYAPNWVKAKPLTIKLTDDIRGKGKDVCGLSSRDNKTIYIDTTSVSWESARTSLIMHELGHYVLDRGHLSDTTTLFDTWKNFPVSFMHPYVGKPSDWNLKREELLEYYMNELFYLLPRSNG